MYAVHCTSEVESVITLCPVRNSFKEVPNPHPDTVNYLYFKVKTGECKWA